MFFLFSGILLVQPVLAQEPPGFIYKAIVLDRSHAPISMATVALIRLSDSAILLNKLSDENGTFEISIPSGYEELALNVSAKGFDVYKKRLYPDPDRLPGKIDTLFLEHAYLELKDVVVSAPVIIYKMKGDTISYAAQALSSPFSDRLSDLINKIPGATVNASGIITIHGKSVSKVLIDGSEFLGKDYGTIIKFIAKEMVDKIEVFDEKNIQGTSHVGKVINIVLKQSAVGKIFGSVEARGGNSSRFNTGANLQYFRDKVKYSAIAGADNVSNYVNEEGSPVSAAGDWRRRIVALRMGKELSKVLTVNGGYQYADDAIGQLEYARRQTSFPDKQVVQQTFFDLDQNMNEHKGSISLQAGNDSAGNIMFNLVGRSLSSRQVTRNSGNTMLTNGQRMANSRNLLEAARHSIELNAELQGHRNLGKRGARIGWGMVYVLSDAGEDNYNRGQILLQDTGSSAQNDSFNLAFSAKSANRQASWMVSLFHPLNEQLGIDISVTGGSEAVTSERAGFHFNGQSQKYDINDSMLSNHFRTRIGTQGMNVGLNYSRSKFKAIVGGGMVWIQQQNESLTLKRNILYRDRKIVPSALITYLFSKRASLYFSYLGQPLRFTMEQVQPVVDLSNPLSKRVGNPDLVIPFSHDIELSYTNAKVTRIWSVGLKYSTVADKINDHVWFDGIQYTQSINSRGNRSGMIYFNYGNIIYKGSNKFSLTVGSNGRFSRDQSLFQFRTIDARSVDLSNNLNISWSAADRFSVTAQYAILYRFTKVRPDTSDKAIFSRQTIGLSIWANWLRSLILGNHFNYALTGENYANSRTRSLLWNISTTYRPFKNRKLSLKLTLYDILRQNQAIVRVTGPAYFEDVRKQVQSRFFMIGIIYDLSPQVDK